MARISRQLLIITVFILIVLGLNTSNAGIASLTMENRKPVLGINRDHNNVNFILLGSERTFNQDRLSNNVYLLKAFDAAHNGYHYLFRIWRIFYAVFLF